MAKLDLQPVLDLKPVLDLEPIPGPVFRDEIPDPTGLTTSAFRTKPWVKPETFKKVGRGIGTGLGVVFWPFKKAEQIVATPLEKTAKEVGAFESSIIENTMYQGARSLNILPEGYKYEPESFPKLAWEVAKSYTEIPSGVWSGIKGGKDAKVFEDYFRGYWKGYTGTDAPKGYAETAGIGAAFLTVPAMVGGALKTIGKVRKIAPIKKAIEARRIPFWQEAKLRSKARIGGGIERATELGRSVGKKEIHRLTKELNRQTGLKLTDKAVQARVGQLIKGGITTRPELAAKANPIIREFQQNAQSLKKLGILGEETYTVKLPHKRIAQLVGERAKLRSEIAKLKSWPTKTEKVISAKTGKPLQRRFPGQAKKVGELQSKIDAITRKIQISYKEGGTEYFPRMYTSKEAELAAKRFPGYSAQRIRAHYAKARKPIPADVRKAMGEIKYPEYPVTKRLIQEASDIETGKLFNLIARKEGWTSQFATPGFKQLPDTKGFGALRGKFVKSKIYDDITEMKRFRGNFEAWYDSMIGTWKAGKVLWNPATHARNMISNSILLDLSGMGHGEQMKYMTRAITEIRNNSREFQFAKRHFARTTLAQGELLDDLLKGVKETGTGMEKMLNAVPHFISKTSAGPASVYQKEEFIFKFLKYLQQRDLGKRPLQAVMEGNKWLFDYSDLSQFERRIARRVMPFYTFPRKAIPVVLEAASVRPHTIAKYPLMAWAMEKHALSRLEMNDKDYAQVKKILPEYMKTGSYILMPYRDNNGDLRFLDWTYLVPWGTISELQERGPLDVFIANPLVQAIGDIKRNKDAFTGRELWKDTDTDKEKYYKGVEHIWRIASPSLAPKGLYWDKLYEAATGKPDTRPRPFPETIAHTIFGLRTQAIDEDEQYIRFLRGQRDKVEELEGKLISIEFQLQEGRIDKEEYGKKQKQYYQQIDGVLKELE